MAYIDIGDSRVWVERTPSRGGPDPELFDYFLVIKADEEHWIELDVDGRGDITAAVLQGIVDEWADEYDIEDVRVVEQKVIRAVG